MQIHLVRASGDLLPEHLPILPKLLGVLHNPVMLAWLHNHPDLRMDPIIQPELRTFSKMDF